MSLRKQNSINSELRQPSLPYALVYKNAVGDVKIENISDSFTGFQITGLNAKTLLLEVTRDTPETMRILDVHPMVIGMVQCLVQRASYTGDLDYEIFYHHTKQRALWETLWSAGKRMGLLPFGMRAMMSLRLDRFFGSWMREFSTDYRASEKRLDRFIAWDKHADFIGNLQYLPNAKRAKKVPLLCMMLMPMILMWSHMNPSRLMERSRDFAHQAVIQISRRNLSLWLW